MSHHSSPATTSSEDSASALRSPSTHYTTQQRNLLQGLKGLQLSTSQSSASAPYVSPYAPVPPRTAQSSSSTKASSTTSSNGSSSSASSTSGTMSASRRLSQTEKATLIQSLRTHRVNTLIELRRIEKIFACLNSPDVTEPMTTAWAHYVNSNNLLSELRGLTKSYPFSSECLDEAKWMVIADPQSTRSWNYCWLVLQKMKNQALIPKHARQLANKPSMWGGRTPTAAGVEQLTAAFVAEWTNALNQLLRHWDSPPTTTGK